MLIATRVLKLRGKGGEIELPIRIFAPTRDETGLGCKCEIDWPGKPEMRTIYGVDEVQAILLTLQFVGSRIYGSDEHKAGSLFWHESGRGYGFPVPNANRDLLVGEDAKYL
jgi:hypothetical protein